MNFNEFSDNANPNIKKRGKTLMTVKQQIIGDDHAKLLTQLIVELLDEKKAEDIVTIDVRQKASFCDFLVIATGNVSRQIIAMADYISVSLKKHNISTLIEGTEQGDWILIDAGDVVVHLFRPEVRERYNIEKMWEA